MDVQIGSNWYRNTDGTIEVEGAPQIELAQQRPSGRLLVNFVVYDETGRVQAKVVDSSMAFNERRALELDRTPNGVSITHGESGKVVLKVELGPQGHPVIPRAEFLSIKGHLLEVSEREWKLEKKRASGQEVDAKGGAAAIG